MRTTGRIVLLVGILASALHVFMLLLPRTAVAPPHF